MIKITGVKKAFGSREILKGIDLTVPTGTVTVILGPSGSGKTTFLRTLNFLEKADAGVMELEGTTVDLHTASKQEQLQIRRRTSMVFQMYNLFSHMTAIENVMEGLRTVRGMAKKDAEKIARECLEEVGMLDFAKQYPSQLSGGQQQRVGIARAIVHRPALLLADEPTGNLDPRLAAEIMGVFEDINRLGTSVLIASHDLALIARMRHRMLTLQRGRLIGDGEAGV